MVQTQSEAKRYLVKRVIQQARSEGVPLSEDECWMLSFSESDPEFKIDPQRVEQLSTAISDLEYETKVAGLLERAFIEDSANYPGTGDAWKQARSVLNQGDHYILVMLDHAVGKHLKRWWEFWI